MITQEIQLTLARPKRWLSGGSGGAWADFPLQELEGMDYGGADLTGAEIIISADSLPDDLRDTVETADEWMASFGAKGKRAVLDSADLDNVNFSGIDLSCASMVGTSLTPARFLGSSLNMTDLSGANIYKGKLDKTEMSGANLSGADPAAAAIALYLCGHTHGGQIRLPLGVCASERFEPLSGIRARPSAALITLHRP